jgi:ketosteroid isomerase-like protein
MVFVRSTSVKAGGWTPAFLASVQSGHVILVAAVTERATHPERLAELLVERVNASDVDGVVALYAPDAVLALPDGQVADGHEAIRRFYAQLLDARPTFEPGEQLPALTRGDLALTSTRLVGGGATAEVARRQPDGTWLWIIDRPNVIS